MADSRPKRLRLGGDALFRLEVRALPLQVHGHALKLLGDVSDVAVVVARQHLRERQEVLQLGGEGRVEGG